MKTKQVLGSLTIIVVFTSCLMLHAMPQIGDLSPRFEATDQNTNRIKLEDYHHNKNVLLYFYPKDFSPGCTAEARGFRDRMQSMTQNNVVVIGVSFDSIETHFKFAQENKLQFSLIADPAGRIAYAFGAKMKGTNLCNRVSFLIDTTGRIVHITESTDPGTHFKEITTAIESLKNGDI